LADNGLRSQIHRKKPQGKPMPEALARANGKKSKVRAYVEHVFAQQKGPMDLVIRTIGLAQATVKIGLANLAYNMKRALWVDHPNRRSLSKPNTRLAAERPLAAQIHTPVGSDLGPSPPHDLQVRSSRWKTRYLEVSSWLTVHPSGFEISGEASVSTTRSATGANTSHARRFAVYALRVTTAASRLYLRGVARYVR
jgi:hypothetical protein